MLSAGIAVGGYYAYKKLVGGAGKDMPLTAVAVRDELVVTVTDRGELEAVDAVNVICELEGGGKLVSIKPEGTRVTKGELVAQIDTDALTKLRNEQRAKLETAQGKVLEFESDLTQAKSRQATEDAKAEKTLKLAELALEAYRAPKGEYENQLQRLKSALELARKELVEAEEDLDFTKEQLKKGRGELTAVKAKELGLTQKRFVVNSAEGDLNLVENFSRKQKITELEFNFNDAKRELISTEKAQASAVKKAENQLATAKSSAEIEGETLKRVDKQIGTCTITAPSDGMVLYVNRRWYGDEGQIRPGANLQHQQPIFNLPDFSKMRVNMKVHEALVKRVQLEQTAAIKLDALPNQLLSGKVTKIGTVAQNDGGWGSRVKAYETQVTLDNVPSEAGLKPGMTAEVKILIRKVADAVLVPVTAVAEIDGQRVVYVVRGYVITRRDVTIGQENEQYVQVLTGLEVGEAVALDARSRSAAELKKATGKTAAE